MRALRSRLVPRFLGILGLVGMAVLNGCQSQAEKAKNELAPVKGKVLVGSAPPVDALITFHADESKGNTAKAMPMGKVRKDGEYELVSGANPGAPLGWYRVTLTTFAAPGVKSPRINPRYTQRDKTNLSVEVVRDPRPGQYDVRLAP